MIEEKFVRMLRL